MSEKEPNMFDFEAAWYVALLTLAMIAIVATLVWCYDTAKVPSHPTPVNVFYPQSPSTP